jgi:lipopolysaccharide biosynthesis glycosyltransferase
VDPSDRAIHVALATDRTYLPWCAVAVSSCQRSTPAPLRVHVLEEGDLTADDRERFAAMVKRADGRVLFHRPDAAAVARLPSKGPTLGGRTSWLRIFLPDLLPEIDRVVYLDADTLVVDSIDPLWSMVLSVPVAAVANVVEPAKHQQVRDLGISDPARYFNAGVLVMDLARMRAEHTLEAVLAFVGSRAELPWYDQDALNVVFAERWQPLPPRWNAQNSLWYWDEWASDVFGERAVEEAVTNPAIVHFEGPAIVKPWHYLSEHPYTREYLRALATTPWCRTRLLERTRATRVIRRLPRQYRHAAYERLEALRARRAGTTTEVHA